ncbi:apolipoprotein D-like [Pelmatolapia mariae]|uniref:apolipoprotein D-like n=1 Tax=Pelmatolapia mariae TaxID=158779 RepID=UPI002FE5952A
MSAVYLLLLLVPTISAQTFRFGACPTPKVQSNFSLQQYLDKWYEIEKLPASFARGQCIEANYYIRKDGTIRVLNSQVVGGKREFLEGTAVVPDRQEPAKLGVAFSYFTPYSPYWVLETNYTNYTIVYSCTDILRIFHVYYAWILARSPSLPPETVHYAKQLLTDKGIDISKMTPTYQNCGNI